MERTQQWLTLKIELTNSRQQQQVFRLLELELADRSLLTVRNPNGQYVDQASQGGVIQVEVPTEPTDPTPPSGGQTISALGLLSRSTTLEQVLPLINIQQAENGRTHIFIAVPI